MPISDLALPYTFPVHIQLFVEYWLIRRQSNFWNPSCVLLHLFVSINISSMSPLTGLRTCESKGIGRYLFGSFPSPLLYICISIAVSNLPGCIRSHCSGAILHIAVRLFELGLLAVLLQNVLLPCSFLVLCSLYCSVHGPPERIICFGSYYVGIPGVPGFCVDILCEAFRVQFP